MNITFSEAIVIALIGSASALVTTLLTGGTQIFKWRTGEQKKTGAETLKATGEGANQFVGAIGVAIENNTEQFNENQRLRKLLGESQVSTAQAIADKFVLEKQYQSRLEDLEKTVGHLQGEIEDIRIYTGQLVDEINRLHGTIPLFVRRNKPNMSQG